MSDLIRQSVIEAWHAFSEPLEGRVYHFYLDVKGLVTIGVGNLVDPVTSALSLPLRKPDGSLATKDEIRADWVSVKSQPSLAKRHYRYAGMVARLRLTDTDIDDLVARKLQSNAQELTKRFPVFPEWPADAQLATLSMAWALGPAFSSRWPNWSQCARDQKWDMCAKSCTIRTEGNPGVHPRNLLNSAHFREASTTLAHTYPDVLHGPRTLDTLRSGWQSTLDILP